MTSAALLLSKLTDAELAHRAWLELDPLTTTDLERELLQRFEATVAQAEADEPLLAVLADREIGSAQQLAAQLDKAAGLDERGEGLALLDVLREFDIDDAQVLRRLLERDAKFTDLMTDLAQPLASLQALATTE